MPDIAFVTFADAPNISDDDELVADILRSEGISVASASWEDASVDWRRFQCVVIRSTWDYHLNPTEYEHWLRLCTSDGVNLWNPPQAVLSNINKQYLLDLARRGIRVVPTRVLSADVRLRYMLEECGWNEAVVKPAVSAGGRGAWRTSLASADVDRRKLERQIRTQEVLLQPYLSEVVSDGEWSLMFFAGEYSHAVIKRPVAGDFRVQQHFGGSTAAAQPPHEIIGQARAIVSTVASKLLYARVDGIVVDGQLLLMELEINEPFLFLSYARRAAERFAGAIKIAMAT